MKRHQQEEGGGDSWMNTYSDMVTLLLCFFVLLLSFSEVNAEKWERIVKAFAHPGDETDQIVIIDNEEGEKGDDPLPNQSDANQLQEGISPSDQESLLPADFDDLFSYLQAYIEENNLSSSVEVSKSGDEAVYIRFQNNIFFSPDEYTLLASSHEVLGFVGDCLHNVEDQIYIISINGHTADAGSDDYAVSDWMLSSERASSVAIYLEEQKGIEPQKLRPMGYGKNFPVASNDTPEGREQNRRVDITIIRDTEGGKGGTINEELASLFDPTQFPHAGSVEEILTPPTIEGETPPEEAGPAPEASAPAAPGNPAVQGPAPEGSFSSEPSVNP